MKDFVYIGSLTPKHITGFTLLFALLLLFTALHSCCVGISHQSNLDIWSISVIVLMYDVLESSCF